MIFMLVSNRLFCSYVKIMNDTPTQRTPIIFIATFYAQMKPSITGVNVMTNAKTLFKLSINAFYRLITSF